MSSDCLPHQVSSDEIRRAELEKSKRNAMQLRKSLKESDSSAHEQLERQEERMKSLELQIERLKKEAAAVSAKHAADKKAAEQRERSAARDAASAVASAKASATALEQQRERLRLSVLERLLGYRPKWERVKKLEAACIRWRKAVLLVQKHAREATRSSDAARSEAAPSGMGAPSSAPPGSLRPERPVPAPPPSAPSHTPNPPRRPVEAVSAVASAALSAALSAAPSEPKPAEAASMAVGVTRPPQRPVRPVAQPLSPPELPAELPPATGRPRAPSWAPSAEQPDSHMAARWLQGAAEATSRWMRQGDKAEGGGGAGGAATERRGTGGAGSGGGAAPNERRAHDGAKPVLLSSQSFSRSADGTTGSAKGLSGGRSPGSVREAEAPRAKPLEEVARYGALEEVARYGSPQVSRLRQQQQQPKAAPAAADEAAAGAGAAGAAPYPVVARQRDDAKDNTPRAKGKGKEGNGLVAQPPSSVELAAYRKMIQSSVGKDGAPRLDSVSLYSLGKLLGKGAFGAVKMGVHKLTGAVVAIKNFKKADVKNEVEARAIDREIRILKQSVHQHIIKLYEVIDSPTNWYLVMECAANGDLAGHLEKKGRLREAEAAKYLVQTVEAIGCCHANGFIHRDIKPENLLLDVHYDIKVTDFGGRLWALIASDCL